ncbi:MAG: sugar nucleotide-binding protein, partial [Myxococcota bacterium]
SKLEGERAAEQAERRLVVRTSWVYSATGKNFLKTMWRLAGTHPRLRVVHDQHARPTSADQLAEALLSLVRREAAGEALPSLLHVTGGGEEASWRDFAAEVCAARAARHGGEPVPVDPISTEDFGAPAPRPSRSTLDTRAAAALGITPGDWRAEVRRTCAVLAAAEERDT